MGKVEEQQRLDALERANRSRIAIKEGLAELRSGADPAKLIYDERLQPITIERFLRSVPVQNGSLNAAAKPRRDQMYRRNRFIQKLGISPSRSVRNMTKREKKAFESSLPV